ncbi:MAG: LPS assembly protein LptD [Alphaproteobacteria bacterium]|nr:LPS assembly protein LptD [Alphaproteobacteria bacterium]
MKYHFPIFFRMTLVLGSSLLVFSSAHALSLDTSSDKTITADRIEFDRKTQSIKTAGDTKMETSDGKRMTLLDAYMDNRGAHAGGQRVEVWLGTRTHFSAASVEKQDNITLAQSVVYTACGDCDTNVNAWEVSADRMRHDADARMMEFYNAVFWAYDVPIFWSPYLSYPDPSIKRKSGFLIPYVNTTNNMGTQVNLPLYIVVSDTHDFTFTPGYLTAENPIWQLEHRLNAHHSSFRTTGSYTSNRAGNDRWHVFNEDLIELGEHARAKLFLQRASDKTYLQHYGFYDAQPFLDSGARMEVFADSGYVRTDAHVFQELRVMPGVQSSSISGDILPNIHGVYQTAPVYGDTYVSFMGDMIGIYNSETAGNMQRMLGSATVTSPWTIWGGQRVTLAASSRYDFYYFNNTDMLDGEVGFSGSRARFLPSGYAQWALPLVNNERRDWTHVIEPRVRYTAMRVLETPAFANIDSSGSVLSDATLFSDNRLSGYDLWVNGDYADYGLGWSAFSRGGISVSGFAGQTYDFSKPKDLDPNSGYHNGGSDFVGRLSAEYKDWFMINNRARFANSNLALRHIESTARLGKRNYVEAGYIIAVQLDDALTENSRNNEIVGGFGLGLTERWNLRTRTIYNITDERIQRQNAGLYYEHPCYMIGFEYLRDGAIRTNLDDESENYVGNTTFKLSFSLKLVEGKK